MPFVQVRPANIKSVRDFANEVKLKRSKPSNEGTRTEVLTACEIKHPEKQLLKPTNLISLESLWKDFRETTTMHGLRHARMENRYHLRW